MKRLKQIRDTAVFYVLIPLSAACMIYGSIGLSGCAFGKGQLNPATGVYDTSVAADKLVVTVERTREIALDAMDTLMKLEFQNRDALLKLNPAIHTFAEGIRVNGKRSLDALTEAKVAFQKSRSTADATRLTNALAAVQSLLTSSINYLAEATAKKGMP